MRSTNINQSKSPNYELLEKLNHTLLQKLAKLKEYEAMLHTYYHSLIMPDGEEGGIQHVNYAKRYYEHFRNRYDEIIELQETFFTLQEESHNITMQPIKEGTLQLKTLVNLITEIQDLFNKSVSDTQDCQGLFMYYNDFIGQVLIHRQSELLKSPINKNNYLDSLKNSWEFLQSLHAKSGKFIPLNFQHSCFLLTVLAKDFPGDKTEINEYIDLYLKSNKVSLEILGPIDLLYKVIDTSLLNTLVYASKTNNGFTSESSTIRKAFNTAIKELQQLINNNGNNIIFAHLYYILIVELSKISFSTEVITTYYNSKQLQIDKNQILIPKEAELDTLHVSINKIKPILEEALKYYKETVVSYKESHSLAVNNYTKTLSQCLNCLADDIFYYLGLLELILKREHSMLNISYYKDKDLETVDKISQHLFVIMDRFKTESEYFLGELMNNINFLLNEINNSEFPHTASFYEEKDEIVLYDVDTAKEKNDKTLKSKRATLNDINNECLVISNNIEELKQQIALEKTKSDQAQQQLLRDEEIAKQKKALVLQKKKQSQNNNKQPAKPPEHIQKEPKKPNLRIQNKPKPLERKKPPSEGWKTYDIAGKSLHDNYMFSIKMYNKALTLATIEGDPLLEATCYQELAHYYYNAGMQQIKRVNYTELFSYNKLIPPNNQQISDENLDYFGKTFYVNYNRHTQTTSLTAISKDFDEALGDIQKAKNAITIFNPRNNKDQETVETIKRGIKFSEDIIQTAQKIVCDFNSLFFIIDTHIKYVEEKKERRRNNPTPKPEYCKTHKKNQTVKKSSVYFVSKEEKEAIIKELSTARDLFTGLLDKHSQLVSNSSEQERYM